MEAAKIKVTKTDAKTNKKLILDLAASEEFPFIFPHMLHTPLGAFQGNTGCRFSNFIFACPDHAD
jgi:hypothetical protein